MGRVAKASLLRAFIVLVFSFTLIIIMMYGAQRSISEYSERLLKTATTTTTIFTTDTQGSVKLLPIVPDLSQLTITLIPLTILSIATVYLIIYAVRLRLRSRVERVEESGRPSTRVSEPVSAKTLTRVPEQTIDKAVRELSATMIIPAGAKLISMVGGFADRVLQLKNIKPFNLDREGIYRCTEEMLEANISMVEPRCFKLAFNGHEFIIEKPTPQKVASIISECSGVKSLKPSYLRVEYSPDFLSLRESIINAYRGSSSTFKISKKTYSRVFLDASRVRKIAAYEYVKHTTSKTIPEDILWTIYGDAFHRAVKILLVTKSLLNAIAAFKETLATSIIKSLVRENEIAEAVKECEKALTKLMDTELFRGYGHKYVRAPPRVILIDDVAAVYATPDFRTVDRETIIDLKTFIPERSKEDSERVEKQIKIFQLAYPYARAVIIAFPYREEYEKPYLKEYDPLSPYEALTYLRDLKKFCLEVGEELEVDFTRTETIRYLVRDDGFTIEVYDLDAKRASNLMGRRLRGGVYERGRRS